MSEADVMREAYAKVWTRANPFPSAQAVAESEAFLSSLDSLREQLTQARAERDAIRTERQEAVAHALHVEERNNIAEVEAAELREQLTQAREAWDTWADHSLRRHKCDWGYTERPEAFATINALANADCAALREQLTQAREALEQLRGDGICIEPLTNPPCGFRFVATGETQPIRPNHPKCIARQALATINEGETEA